MATPFSRSKEVLEGEGYHFARVEHWNSFARKRQDLGGFADALCWKPEETGVLAINATTNENLSHHKDKYQGNQKLIDWIKARNRFEIWCWAKMGPRGKRKLWTLKRVPVTAEELVRGEPSMV